MKHISLVRRLALCATLAPTIAHSATPIAYVGIAYGSSSSGWGPVTVNVPTGTQNGDLMLAYIATQSTNGAWLTAPAGWVQVTKTFNSVQGAQLFQRIANNEPASYSWTGTSYPQVVIRTYRNVDATTPIVSSAGCGSINAVSCKIPALTETAASGERYIGFWDFNIATAPISGPADLGNGSRNLTQRSMFSGDKLLSASAVPSETATVAGAANYWDAIGVTIKLAGATAPPTGPNPPAPPAPPAGGVAAVSANDFLNSLGVNVHAPGNNGSTPAQYAPLINYTGIRNFRSDYNAADNISLGKLTNAKALWFLQFSGPVNLGSNINSAKQIAAAGVLLAVEGVNEPNNWPVTYNGATGGGTGSWLPVAKLQSDLYAAVKSDSQLKNYPVFQQSGTGAQTTNAGLQYGLSIPPGANTGMPDGTKFADYANMHNYVIWAGSSAPVDNVAWYAAAADLHVSPAGNQDLLFQEYGSTWAKHYVGNSDAQLLTLPRVTTETGWWSDSGGVENQGRILLNVYLSQYKRGYKYTFLYELVDEGGDHFGMYLPAPSYTPKPGATYIHNLTTILSDNKAVATTAGSLAYSIPNQPATVHDLLLQKSTGAFELVVWDERPIGEATDRINVNLGGSHAKVNVYDTTTGVTAIQTLSNVGSVPLTLTDHPMIIEVIQ